MLSDFMGGNSTKATSGINGALTRTQVDLKIQDSVKQFYDDTLKSARDKARPDLIKVLTYKSAAAVEWLQDVFNLDLTLVSRLGFVLFLYSLIISFPNVNALSVVTHNHVLTVVTMPNFQEWPLRMRSCKSSRSWRTPNHIACSLLRRPRSPRSTRTATWSMVSHTSSTMRRFRSTDL